MRRPYSQFQIGLLGPFYLEVDQQEIKEEAWKSKKALTLLKYLAAKQGQKVVSDVLIELLWPDNEDVDSTSNLHTAVWFARRMLASTSRPEAESPLHYAHGSYWLDLTDGGVDLEFFRGHVQKSRQVRVSDPEAALLHCESALELYRDDFLPEDMYEEWTVPYREDYRELYFEIILRSAELLMEHRGDLQGAIDILRSAVKRDPFREELYHMGIKFYILAERHVDAINLYKRYSKMLMDEFRLQPSQATQDLILHLQEQGPENGAASGSNLQAEPITGAYVCNRETLQFILRAEQRRLERGGNGFAVLLVANKDGHPRRQQIQAAFHILQRSLRNSDLISQYSDDLMVVFLPDTEVPEAKEVLRRLKQRIQEKLAEISPFSYKLVNSASWEEIENNLATVSSQ